MMGITDSKASSKIEFAVQMTCDSCVNAIRQCVKDNSDIKIVDVDLKNNSVLVDTVLPTLEAQKILERSGRKVAVKGHEGSIAGVAILESSTKNIQGVIRFIQIAPMTCIIDGTIDGLAPGSYEASVHEYGDISEGCNNVGDIYTSTTAEKPHGLIGRIEAEESGRATFRLEHNLLNISDIIGRSFVISQNPHEGYLKKIACGIITRSAGLFTNPKTICACDGVTIWNEKVAPKATL